MATLFLRNEDESVENKENGLTNLSNHVSSSITPTGRFPFRYSLQYPPGKQDQLNPAVIKLFNVPCRSIPSAHGRNEKPLRGLSNPSEGRLQSKRTR